VYGVSSPLFITRAGLITSHLRRSLAVLRAVSTGQQASAEDIVSDSWVSTAEQVACRLQGVDDRFKQLYHAFRLCFRLKQTFIYLASLPRLSQCYRSNLTLQAAYFFLGDCLNTLVTVIATLQNEAAAFDTKTLN